MAGRNLFAQPEGRNLFAPQEIPVEPEEEKGFLERVDERRLGRIDEVTETFRQSAEGEITPLETFSEVTRTELEQVRNEMTEIGMLVEQSQGEVDKLAKRNASITAHLHQIQAHFDSVPREDIRSTYEAFQDAQQRLFTMRGQLEKLQSDEAHLNRFEKYYFWCLSLMKFLWEGLLPSPSHLEKR